MIMQTRKIKTRLERSGFSKLICRKRHYFRTDLKIKACNNKSIRSIQMRCGQFVGELEKGAQNS